MYTISIKLKSPEKAARQSAIYPQPQTDDTAHHGLGFPSYFLCQNLQNQKKTPHFASFGKGWEETSCLDNSLSARTRGVYQVLMAVLVDKDRKTQAF